MDYEKYNNALEKAKARYNEIKDTNCSEKKFLLDLFPELRESEDERIRKDIMILVKDWWDRVNKDDISTKEQMIAWLEKQKATDKEIVFRPLAGTDIIVAAKQALEKIEIGKEIILAFNGAYIPVNGKTVAEICNEYFAWTEKQNKNNSENYCEDCINRKGCINCENGNLKETEHKVEPKFKVGDWIVNNEYGSIGQITDIIYDESGYGYNHTNGWFHSVFEKDYHLWTIADAKDGDVLAAQECYVIFKEIDGLNIKCHCTYHYMGFNPSFHINTLQNKTAFQPATKEQRELLFKEMKESGYQWDVEKKELKKIEDEIEIPFGAKDSELQEVTYYIPKGFHAEIDDDKVIIKKGEKPTWSEEDEKMYRMCVDAVEYYHTSEDESAIRDWFKSLKERLS